MIRANPNPAIGFVSLGCPKATVDSECILTQLRAEGYAISPTYADADLVVVNTCGFIDAAVAESLEAIGEALAENGRVVVTGCLGARAGLVWQAHPKVSAVTGPQTFAEVMAAVHALVPAPHDPFLCLLPPQGVKLTPKHYAYLKISEGCNHRCTFCIIPSLRGDLVSRPIGAVLDEAHRLVEAGVIERRTAVLNPERVGAGLTVIVEITLAEQAAERMAAFEALVADVPEVQQCYRVSPGPDFVLVLLVVDMAAYHALVHRLFTAANQVRNVRAFFSVHRSKFAPRVPGLISS